MPLTYFVALPFIRNDAGELVPGEGERRLSSSAASDAARRMADRAAGAVAFSRTGDPSSGDYDEAVVIATFGEVPSLDELMSAD